MIAVKDAVKALNDARLAYNQAEKDYAAGKITKDALHKSQYCLSGVVSIPGDILKTLDTIARMNIVGDTPADFEKLGQAQMLSALNVISLILSQGAVTVAKNGVTVVVEATSALKEAKLAEIARKKQIVENNVNRDDDLPNVFDRNPNAPADRAITQKKDTDIEIGLNNPHYDSKHGAYTTLEQQYDRAINGTNPQTDRKERFKPNASKFFNSTDMHDALIKAEELYKKNPSEYEKGQVDLILNRAVGEGYMGDNPKNIKANTVGEYRRTNTITVRIDEQTGKAYTAYPNLEEGTVHPDPRKH